MTKNILNRRQFIKKTAGAASLIAAPSILRGERDAQKLRIACIGIGGRGQSHVDGVANEQIVAFCDVDKARSEKKTAQYPKIPLFSDYREMFAEMGDKIDAVTISTPDHMHFPIAMAGIALGKHVLCEKPLTHTIWEARELTRAAREKGVVTQMGNQGHAAEGTRLMKEWIQAGVIGDVREVHCYTNRPKWPQGKEVKSPKGKEKVPHSLDWDKWLGVAQDRKYSSIYAPFKWRAFWDFGTGALGDMGCHLMDASYWALDLGAPISIEATSTNFTREVAPSAALVTYQFPARGNKPPVKLVWHDGGLQPPFPKTFDTKTSFLDGQNGQVIIGEKATIVANTYCTSLRIAPETKMQELRKSLPPKTIPRVKNGDHFQEWIDGCKGGPKPGSNFDYSGPFTEMVLLGNLAIRSRRFLEWDSDALKIKNAKEANQYLSKTYRSGWGV